MATAITIDAATVNQFAFYNCQSLISVTFTENVTSIETSAFGACYHIIEVYDYSALNVTAGQSTTNGHIGYYASYVYTSTSTDSGEFITEGDYTFYAYTSGETITYYIVKYNGNETELTLPALKVNGQTVNYSIYNNAFTRNKDITSVVIPDSVTSIGVWAFYGCSSLESVVIGDGVASIESNAFSSCSALTEIYYNGTSDSYNNITINDTSTTFTGATVYFYAANDGTTTAVGNYWYYENGNIVTWTVEETSGGSEG